MALKQVTGWQARRWKGKNLKLDTLRVDYIGTGFMGFAASEWLSFDAAINSYPWMKAISWWDAHVRASNGTAYFPPGSVEDALHLWSDLTCPVAIEVEQDPDTGFDRVLRFYMKTPPPRSPPPPPRPPPPPPPRPEDTYLSLFECDAATLGREPTEDDVRRAFRRWALKAHPDVDGGSHEKMLELTEFKDKALIELKNIAEFNRRYTA